MAAAGPGGAHESTLLLVWGDHGQTDGGDHGGGTPPEVDSALVAVDLAALHRLRRSPPPAAAADSPPGLAAPMRGVSPGAQKRSRSGETSGGSCPGGGRAEGCRRQCNAAWQQVGRIKAGQRCQNGRPTVEAPAGRQPSLVSDRGPRWQELPQVDYAPTMAAVLGVPAPYGSIGRVSPHLWAMRGCPGGALGEGGATACSAEYADVLRRNAWQVRRPSAVSGVRSCCPAPPGVLALALSVPLCSLRIVAIASLAETLPLICLEGKTYISTPCTTGSYALSTARILVPPTHRVAVLYSCLFGGPVR